MARPPRVEPRLSATQLADYMAATSPIAQMGILRNAKYPGDAKPLIIQYQLAKGYIAQCLFEPESLNHTVAGAITSLLQRRDDPSNRPLIREDARRCILTLQTFQGSVNALSLWTGARYEAPPSRATALQLSGVTVNVAPDAVAIAGHRTGDRVGEVFIRCNIGGEGEGAENRRAESNGHLAVIAHMHSVATLSPRGTPHSSASLVIDVPRERVIHGPASTTMRVRQIETACAMIAAIWPTI